MKNRTQSCQYCLTHLLLPLRQAFLLAVCRSDGLRDADADAFLVELRKEAFGSGAAVHQRVDELLGSVPGYAQRLWTSVSTLRSPGTPPRELCGLINRAIRLDDPALLQPLMVLPLLPRSVSCWRA